MKALYFIGCLAVLAPGCALAQVTVNPVALQQLAGIPSPAPKPQPEAAPKPVPVAQHVVPRHKHVAPAAPKPVLAKPETAQPVPVVAPVVPKAAPAAAPAPVAPAPAAPAPAPAPAPAKPPGPVLLKFAPDSSDLPPDAAALLKPFCAATRQVSIDARAPATPGDPSAAMRLSLARAIAVHDALQNCGTPAQNLLPRAMGSVPGQDEDSATLTSGVN